MSKTLNTMNWTKWGFIIGTPIAIVGLLISSVSIMDIETKCRLGIELNRCPIQQKIVELKTATEEGTPLPNVKILVSAKGAPETTYADSNGYAKVKVPSEGDASITLTKTGYPPQNFVINLASDQSTTRTIRLSKSGNPDIQSDKRLSTSSPVSSPIPENKSTLLDSNCQSSTAGNTIENMFHKGGVKFTFGKEIVEGIAFIGSTDFDSNIQKSSPIEFVCGLSNSYKELKTIFGIHSANSYALAANKIEFEIFLDSKSAGKKIVSIGNKQEWSFNIQGVRNVSFKAICMTEVCPSLSFSELSLR